MLSEKHIGFLRYFNPWWEGKKPDVPSYHRSIYSKIKKYLKTKQIIALIGLRRIGKTVLMRQIMKELLETNQPENIMYFLFDDLMTQTSDVLEDVLEYYLKALSKNGTKYIFLDEIQKIPFWQDILKRYYDTREDIKFIVSGSASLNIKKSTESLAGRIYDFYVPILSFREFLELNALPIQKGNLTYQDIKILYEQNLHKKPQIFDLLEKYIQRGAFPEIAREDDQEIIYSYIRNSVTNNLIYEDIPSVFKIARKDILYSMLEYCARETSNLLEINNLAELLKINYRTSKTYLFYLEQSFVFSLIYNNSRSFTKQLRKNKKIHVIHPCITLALLRSTKYEKEQIGKYIETIVFGHISQIATRMTFWRSPQKEEVDMIAEIDGKTIPIEVKFQETINSQDTHSLLKFMDLKSINFGIIVTRDEFKEVNTGNKTILYFPVWLLLLII